MTDGAAGLTGAMGEQAKETVCQYERRHDHPLEWL
jgi:hypothetical protein